MSGRGGQRGGGRAGDHRGGGGARGYGGAGRGSDRGRGGGSHQRGGGGGGGSGGSPRGGHQHGGGSGGTAGDDRPNYRERRRAAVYTAPDVYEASQPRGHKCAAASSPLPDQSLTTHSPATLVSDVSVEGAAPRVLDVVEFAEVSPSTLTCCTPHLRRLTEYGTQQSHSLSSCYALCTHRLARLSCRRCCHLSRRRMWWRAAAAVASSSLFRATFAAALSPTTSTACPTASAPPPSAR